MLRGGHIALMYPVSTENAELKSNVTFLNLRAGKILLSSSTEVLPTGSQLRVTAAVLLLLFSVLSLT